MTAAFHVTLHCEHDACPATFTNGGRYASVARIEARETGGWKIVKGRAPNAYHDFCPEHGVSA